MGSPCCLQNHQSTGSWNTAKYSTGFSGQWHRGLGPNFVRKIFLTNGYVWLVPAKWFSIVTSAQSTAKLSFGFQVAQGAFFFFTSQSSTEPWGCVGVGRPLGELQGLGATAAWRESSAKFLIKKPRKCWACTVHPLAWLGCVSLKELYWTGAQYWTEPFQGPAVLDRSLYRFKAHSSTIFSLLHITK